MASQRWDERLGRLADKVERSMSTTTAGTWVNVRSDFQHLQSGQLPAEDDSVILDTVLHHGRHWSLNNRHLRALKLFLREVQPMCLRSHIIARVRVWPLTPELRSHGQCRLEKFAEAYSSTNDRGSLRLRSRSPSLPRRVRFDAARAEI